MTWLFPFNDKKLSTSPDSNSFAEIDLATECIVPIAGHLGAFGTQRRYHRHEGVDLYCNPGEAVHAVEAGVVVNIVAFTGPLAGSDWWNDTKAVLVEGESGVICYGEIEPNSALKVGARVEAGAEIGTVITVLKVDKGRPMTMLHIELYERGTRDPLAWVLDTVPHGLLDPTPNLLEALKS